MTRQGKRSPASRRHVVARQAVEIRAMSSVERAHGMTIKGQRARIGGVGSLVLPAPFFLLFEGHRTRLPGAEVRTVETGD